MGKKHNIITSFSLKKRLLNFFLNEQTVSETLIYENVNSKEEKKSEEFNEKHEHTKIN